jgi:hypothetical protein
VLRKLDRHGLEAGGRVEGILDGFAHKSVRDTLEGFGGEKFTLDGINVHFAGLHRPEAPLGCFAHP